MNVQQTAASLSWLAVVACGSRTDLPGPGPAPAAPATAECARTTLVAAPPAVLPAPNEPYTSDLSISTTPSGDRVLVRWWSSLALVADDARGPTLVKAFDVPSGSTRPPGVGNDVAFDGRSFIAISDAPAALRLLTFSPDGDPLGAANVSLPPSSPSGSHVFVPISAISAPGGVAFTWYDAADPLDVHASLVTPEGSVVRDVSLVSDTFDPHRRGGPSASLATYGGDVLALSTTGRSQDLVRLSKLGWGGGAASTTTIAGTSGSSRAWPLLVAGNRLLFANDQGSTTVLFAGTPDAGFAAVWQLPQATVAQAVDGCGRFVALSSEDDPASGSLLVAHTLQDASPAVPLGDVYTQYAPPVVVGTSNGFVVVWEDHTHSLELARLTWE